MSFLLRTCGTGDTAYRKTQFSIIPWLKQWWLKSKPTHLQNPRSISILCTDIVSFSQRLACLTGQGQTEMVRDLTLQYYPLLRQAVHKYNGRVDKFMGDGMLAIFHGADHAVSAAVTLRQTIAEFNQARCAEKLSIFPTRFAVHRGDVYVIGCRWHPFGSLTYLGEAVNTASYLASVVPSGRVFISANTLASLSNPPLSWLWQTIPNKGTNLPLFVYEIAD